MVPNPPSILADAATLLALAALAAAALRDVACREIPNPIAATVALVGLARQVVNGAPLPALVAAGCVLLAATLLWSRGLLGGGDVKLLTAASVLVPVASVPALLLATALAGGLLAGLHMMLRRRLGAFAPAPSRGRLPRILRCEAWRIRRGAPLPYGVAIAAGTVFVMTRQGG
ncbi:prepilin peptidase [Roseomonas rosulenta]|uniref:prepilin peptidase n=1 Tax=Roseomonas rosulenta TaxID=2748667 RepID=UPI0018DEF724|nr:A24 family peptidase [Roseomonas rosulenta]